jgi:FRG domain
MPIQSRKTKGNKLVTKKYTEENIPTFDALLEKSKELTEQNCWIYRGHKSHTWGLSTTFDRMMDEWQDHPMPRNLAEIGLIKKFQREAKHFGVTESDFTNIPNWLALMQHFSAPTRLLDWSHSFWVALYFAVVDMTSQEESCSVFCLNNRYLHGTYNHVVSGVFRRDHNTFNIVDFDNICKSGHGVIILNSFNQNTRQINQQGTFSFPLNINVSYEDNLVHSINVEKADHIFKLVIPFHLKPMIMRHIYRMNISYATLYPGLEGFGKLLKHLFYIPRMLQPEEDIVDFQTYGNRFNT